MKYSWIKPLPKVFFLLPKESILFGRQFPAGFIIGLSHLISGGNLYGWRWEKSINLDFLSKSWNFYSTPLLTVSVLLSFWEKWRLLRVHLLTFFVCVCVCFFRLHETSQNRRFVCCSCFGFYWISNLIIQTIRINIHNSQFMLLWLFILHIQSVSQPRAQLHLIIHCEALKYIERKRSIENKQANIRKAKKKWIPPNAESK